MSTGMHYSCDLCILVLFNYKEQQISEMPQSLWRTFLEVNTISGSHLSSWKSAEMVPNKESLLCWTLERLEVCASIQTALG